MSVHPARGFEAGHPVRRTARRSRPGRRHEQGVRAQGETGGGSWRGGEWTEDASVGFIKTLGVLELLAAVGLILPAVVDIAPVLVPVAAVCWVLLMIGAMITHLRHGGLNKFVLLNVIYFALAAFIAWGRFGLESFTV